jgi:hypothetical protein
MEVAVVVMACYRELELPSRYRGLRKNLFDLRRCAVVHNLHVMARFTQQAQAA